MKFPESGEFRNRWSIFLLGLSEQLQESSKVWFLVLAIFVIVAWPAKYIMQKSLTAYFIRSYHPPEIVSNPYSPEALTVVKKAFLAVGPNEFSAYAQLQNPNAELSAKKIVYRFLFRDEKGATLRSFTGETYLLAGESRFVLLPSASLSVQPTGVDLVFDEINWVRRVPSLEVKFDVMQKAVGATAEGGFFAEFLVKNPQGYRLKKVDVQVLVFDRLNQSIVAVNSSQFTDLKPFESRYVRVVWP